MPALTLLSTKEEVGERPPAFFKKKRPTKPHGLGYHANHYYKEAGENGEAGTMATTGANVLRRRRQDDDDSDDESEEETSEEMDRNAENAAFAHAAAKIHMQDEKGMKVWR